MSGLTSGSNGTDVLAFSTKGSSAFDWWTRRCGRGETSPQGPYPATAMTITIDDIRIAVKIPAGHGGCHEKSSKGYIGNGRRSTRRLHDDARPDDQSG
jgi:hypothetical protein